MPPVTTTRAPAPSAVPPPRPQDSFRETVESIVVAFILAFLFRSFLAEAFVIPTGSMAPTLFGRHKDVRCPQCGFVYEVGASEELDDEGVRLVSRIRQATCPNCRYTADVYELPAFKGDRILVNKFPYEWGKIRRWDVCVFKYPEWPERNYIKRMIGLPGETIRISRGDVYARREGEATFEILRKEDPWKQDRLQIVVYDDRYPPRKLLQAGWPERWAGMTLTDQEDPSAIAGWIETTEGVVAEPQRRSYTVVAEQTPRWLRYRHYQPTELDWEAWTQGEAVDGPAPRLITDFYAYNSSHRSPPDDVFWVGDLTISGVVEVLHLQPEAEWWLELVEGIRQYRCRIDLHTGRAELSHNNELLPGGEPIVLGTAQTPIRGIGRYSFTFANVDDRLCLWINRRLISFERQGTYSAPAIPDPQPADLTPVGLAARQATLRFSRLVLKRDIYYRAERVDNLAAYRTGDGEDLDEFTRAQLRDALSSPEEYADIYNRKAGAVEFAPLQAGEYFVMGDNSPRSQDSRLWSNQRGAVNRHAVPRSAMVGKAFLVYWPHGIPFLNHGKGYGVWNHPVGDPRVENYPAFTIPFYPQAPAPFGRWLMRIR
ncbi:MAG: signal peptidase I [Planctomycetaceae bacterium]|nr:MAG: signal peptidase I [Planctomycetaceae bacterium]